MGYFTFYEQQKAHLEFLRGNGCKIDELKINAGFIRCHSFWKHVSSSKRGELSYSTRTTLLENGLLGLSTFYRGLSGQIQTYRTYGLLPETFPSGPSYSLQRGRHDEVVMTTSSPTLPCHKIKKFWDLSAKVGYSDYLIHKEVGAYGIRFRSNQYGRVAVVPIRDLEGQLWGCQLLNSDGSKRLLKGSVLSGHHHVIGIPCEGQPIGISESYVTAVTW